MTNRSAGAGRDGSRLREALDDAFEAGHMAWPSPDLPTRAAMRTHAVDNIMARLLAVPDPLASDTGQGEYETCVRSIAETHRAIGYGYRGSAPEVAKEWNWKADALFAAADALKAAPLASSSAPQGEKSKT